MGLGISTKILGLNGQKIKEIKLNKERDEVIIHCVRDKRRKVIDPLTQVKGTVNQYIKRQVKDIPIFGRPCQIEIELAQVITGNNIRRIEACDFVDKKSRVTHRFGHMISGLCRHMSIQAVSKHLNLSWRTVKNIDQAYLTHHLPALEPSQLSDLKYIGVDEVARAKGHDYMTVIYDMCSGYLIGVETGRTSAVFSQFLNRIPKEVRDKIEAVAMDMGPAYQKSVREVLPHAEIVFDRFHVMQNYSKVIKNQRRTEFRKALKKEKALIKGSLYLLLKNPDKLSETQSQKLDELLENNNNLNIIYLMKEQLQQLWSATSCQAMNLQLETWCKMADKTNMTHLKTFAKSLRKNVVGICNYAKYQLTSARIEAGNVAIGMIRKRARGILDTEYFKLKIRQSSMPDDQSMFYSDLKSQPS